MKKALIALAIALVILLAYTPSVSQENSAYRICRIVNQPMLTVDIARKEVDTSFFIGGSIVTCGENLYKVVAVRVSINTSDSTHPTAAVVERLELGASMLRPNADTTCVSNGYVAPIHGGLLRLLLTHPSVITILGEEEHSVNVDLCNPDTRMKIAQMIGLDGLFPR